MRIALVTNGIWPYVMGGMQKHSFYLCKYLAQKGVEVDLYHLNQQAGYDIEQLEFFTEAEKRKINSFVVPLVEKTNTLPGHYLRHSRKQSRAIFTCFQQTQRKVDLIYTKGLAGWEFIREKEKGASLPPILLNVHGYEMYQKAASLKGKLQQWLLRPVFNYLNQSADYIFSYGGGISDIITQKLQIPHSKIIEIPTGIGEDWLVSPAEILVNHPRRLVFIGRFERRKGIKELTAALEGLVERHDFLFEFIGPIPAEKRIHSDKVKYYGALYDKVQIQTILQRADVLVTPSYAEGMPNVILEGMARGCVVIATNVGAVSAQVASDNGWLIAPGNVQQLKDAITAAITASDKVLLEKKHVSIAKVKSQFLWSTIVDQHYSAFENIINQ